MNSNSEKRLAAVHPILARKVRALVAALVKQGFVVEVTQGLRTIEEQNVLFAQGRTRKGLKVTNARGGSSYHNFGLAVDFALMMPDGRLGWPTPHTVWAAIGREAEKVGLEWGGKWRKPDLPHVQLKRVPTVQECYALYLKGKQNALVWSAVERMQL